jgi:hypothetical protein
MSLMAWMGKEELVEADWDGCKAACPTEVEKLAAGGGCVVARHSEGKARGPATAGDLRGWGIEEEVERPEKLLP